MIKTIRRLQPKAVTAIMGDDVRWVGNEKESDVKPVECHSIAAGHLFPFGRTEKGIGYLW